MLAFASDYMEGAHPEIIKRLSETNLLHSSGYGTDDFSNSARTLIRKACNTPNAQIQFLTGGTQTNQCVIDCLLKSWQGVICASSGHIAVHEAGAIEFTGHKVLPLNATEGKISASQVENYLQTFYADDNNAHMVEPGLVYISQPTEMGTLYSLEELTALSKICRKNKIPLYVDGARLSYALGSPENDVSLKDLACLCQAFYIGGTKCGALFGEAVVIPEPDLIPHFETQLKQHGALLAKGRINGLQFQTLFTDDLYFKIGRGAVELAQKIQAALVDNGYKLLFKSPTNQIFFIIENQKLKELSKKVMYSFWEKYDENHTLIRFCTSWATTKQDTEKLIKILQEI